MMVIKSFALGLGIFLIGTIAYLVFKVQTLPPPPPTPPGTYGAIGISIGYFWNSWFWMWLVASFVLGYCVARQFRARA
jgi:hypothetical protein